MTDYRAIFASHAMGAIIARYGDQSPSSEMNAIESFKNNSGLRQNIAEAAFAMADAMMIARKEQQT